MTAKLRGRSPGAVVLAPVLKSCCIRKSLHDLFDAQGSTVTCISDWRLSLCATVVANHLRVGLFSYMEIITVRASCRMLASRSRSLATEKRFSERRRGQYGRQGKRKGNV